MCPGLGAPVCLGAAGCRLLCSARRDLAPLSAAPRGRSLPIAGLMRASGPRGPCTSAWRAPLCVGCRASQSQGAPGKAGSSQQPGVSVPCQLRRGPYDSAPPRAPCSRPSPTQHSLCILCPRASSACAAPVQRWSRPRPARVRARRAGAPPRCPELPPPPWLFRGAPRRAISLSAHCSVAGFAALSFLSVKRARTGPGAGGRSAQPNKGSEGMNGGVKTCRLRGSVWRSHQPPVAPVPAPESGLRPELRSSTSCSLPHVPLWVLSTCAWRRTRGLPRCRPAPREALWPPAAAVRRCPGRSRQGRPPLWRACACGLPPLGRGRRRGGGGPSPQQQDQLLAGTT